MSNEIDREGRQHIETEDARAGATNTGLRYVLIVSLALVIILFAAIYLFT